MGRPIAANNWWTEERLTELIRDCATASKEAVAGSLSACIDDDPDVLKSAAVKSWVRRNKQWIVRNRKLLLKGAPHILTAWAQS